MTKKQYIQANIKESNLLRFHELYVWMALETITDGYAALLQAWEMALSNIIESRRTR